MSTETAKAVAQAVGNDAPKADKVIVAAGLAELRAFAVDTMKAAKIAGSASAHLILAAIKSADHFADTVEAFYSEIRQNTGGFAKKIGAETDADGQRYVVPDAIMTQVSQIRRAVRLGVNLGTADAPRAITAIRKDTKAAADKKAEADLAAKVMSPADLMRRTMFDKLTDVLSFIKGAEGEALQQVAALTADYVRKVTEVQARVELAKAAQKAEDAAKAPAGKMLPNGREAGKGRAQAVAAAA